MVMPTESFISSPMRITNFTCWMEIALLHCMRGKIKFQTFSYINKKNNLVHFQFFSGRYLMDLVTKCGVDLKLGIVQTAYANGGSTDYITTELVSKIIAKNLSLIHPL